MAADDSIRAALQTFQRAQARRAIAFSEFHAAFAAFVDSKDRDAFETSCAAATAQFQLISAAVNECEAQLRADADATSWADLLRKLQSLEKLHLEMVREQ